MALLQNVIGRGTHAARPAAGSAGLLWFETDTGQLFRDSGSAWQLDDSTLLYTAKGQLLASSASSAVGALAAGTNGYVLTADSSQTLGVKWATAGQAALATASAQLSGNVSIAAANTFYDGPSVSLGAGTWLCWATLILSSNTLLNHFTAKLWDGTTASASTQMSIENNNVYRVLALVSPPVVLGSTTTYKVSVACSTSTGTLYAAAANNGAGNTACTLVALQVA